MTVRSTPAAAPAIALLLALFGTARAAEPVSWSREVVPVIRRSCSGCHNPNKKKGGLDASSHAALLAGGKHGPALVAGDPGQSEVLKLIRGPEPEMPPEGDGDPLSPDEVALIERWIREGALLDAADVPAAPNRPASPPVYHAAPVIPSLDISPDGSLLAVAAHHEVVLLDMATLDRKARLVGGSPRIESVAFSPDGSRLLVAGGQPSRYGEIQVWRVSDATLEESHPLTGDTVFGASWSPDGSRIAVGATDNSARVLEIPGAREVLKFDNHSDWVLRTTWVAGGRRLLSGGRDRAMKLVDVASGQFIDDINKLIEPVLALARHPREDWVAYGGDLGGLRLYRAKENQERTAANNDVNQVREFERQPGPVAAVAFSQDGQFLAAGGPAGEVRVYRTDNGTRVLTLGNHAGAVFALGFHPDGSRLVTGGFDGLVRVFDLPGGQLRAILTPVPVTPPTTAPPVHAVASP